ncbi:MAG TPA: hypothetical protein VHX86_01815 [Tepidisphaeraceae bacterium]|jgi:ElaB/YqjD/DUF883 family membrane-anchored ribosome-binding protein|nr:hypothetical protein [Tepidisphaeraceae bacterium]
MSRISHAHNPEHESDAGNSAADDLKHKAAEVGKNIREMGGQIGDAAREQYEGFRDRASDYFDQGRKKARKWEHGVENYIQEKPVHALLWAAGVGMLLGLLWRRR